MYTSIKRSAFFLLLCLGILFPPTSVYSRISDEEFEDIVQEEVEESKKIKELNDDIEDKASSVRELEEKLDIYERNVEEKLRERITLENHIAVLEDSIEGTKTEIEKIGIELEVLELEIEALQEHVRQLEDDIATKQDQLKELLVDVYVYDQKKPLEITFQNSTFSDFFSQLQYTHSVQSRVQDVVQSLRFTKEQLNGRREEMSQKRSDLSVNRENLELEKQNLEGEEKYKEQVLEETKLSEEQFQTLLENAKQQQAQIEGEIAALEKKAQEKISKIRAEIQKRLEDTNAENDELTDQEQEILDGVVRFIWPIDSRTITCGFHCPDYPYENYIGAHSGLDIATPMGTTVRAAASGYVTRAYFDGTSNLAWLLIDHVDGLTSTVYMHLSCISVSVDQYVNQGDPIGCSGGMPGTPGAGLSNGPHLHFEIRLDGIATDPLQYLP